MSVVRAEWGKMPIPGEQGSLTEPVLGTLDYDIHNITLLPNPVLPDPVVRLVSPSSMNVQMYARSSFLVPHWRSPSHDSGAERHSG